MAISWSNLGEDNTDILQMSLVHETRKLTVESMSKQLEYVTKGKQQCKQYCFKFKQLYSLVPFSCLVATITVIIILKLKICSSSQLFF